MLHEGGYSYFQNSIGAKGALSASAEMPVGLRDLKGPRCQMCLSL